jgi:hypothetical protein
MSKSILALATGIATLAGAFLSTPASAAPLLGEYSVTHCCGSSDGAQVGAAANGLGYAGQVNPNALNNVDVIVAGAYASQFTSWVAAGGALIIHDWFGNSTSLLPGMHVTPISGTGSNVDVVDPASPVVNGPFGTLTNTNMDGGNSSVHGAVGIASLTSNDPLVSDIHAILNNGTAGQIAEFSYRYGQGLIIYAFMPTDAYSGSSPFQTGGTAGLNMLAKNEIAFAASFDAAPAADVPEPASLGLIGLGTLALAAARRRKNAR